jgi:hypothetical protein
MFGWGGLAIDSFYPSGRQILRCERSEAIPWRLLHHFIPRNDRRTPAMTAHWSIPFSYKPAGWVVCFG